VKIPPHTKKRLIGGAVTAAICAVCAVGYAAVDNQGAINAEALDAVCVTDLPDEVDATIADIADGEPYAYDEDGTVFQNREGVLPGQDTGYYHEFTVETPGLDHRGAKRIVTGGEIADQVDDYYTDDHYRSFRVIDYACGDASPSTGPADSSSGPKWEPGGEPTATPPAGTDLDRVGVMCFKDANSETVQTLELISKYANDRSKFPYPHKDGSIFEWREYDEYPFPKKPDGYYLEWTVPTPGAENRARQRIVTGGEPDDKVEDFYTDDHYDTFKLIDYGC
jgi:ribonuclease T1